MEGFFVEPTLYTGRDGEKSAAGSKQGMVYDFLDRLEISYMRADHAPADTIAQCGEIEKILGAKVCKNLFLRSRQADAFYLLLLPGDKPFRTAVVSKLLGVSRLSFAEPEYLSHYLGVTPGSVSALGLIHDTGHAVRVLIDREVCSENFIGCHPCVNTSTLRLHTADLLGKFLPAVGHTPTILDIPRPAPENGSGEQ